jgi:hypothetical protein
LLCFALSGLTTFAKEEVKMAKCPSCTKSISSPRLERTEIVEGTKRWNGVYLVCPVCNAVLGAEIDPVFLHGDLLFAIRKFLEKKLS